MCAAGPLREAIAVPDGARSSRHQRPEASAAKEQTELAVAMVRDWLTALAVPCGSVILTAPPRTPVASMTLRQTVG